MFTFVLIVFVFFSDLFIFSNVEAFISFLIFLTIFCFIFLSFYKLYYNIFWYFISNYKPILVTIFKLLEKFEYFDQIYKFIKFLVKLKKISLLLVSVIGFFLCF